MNKLGWWRFWTSIFFKTHNLVLQLNQMPDLLLPRQRARSGGDCQLLLCFRRLLLHFCCFLWLHAGVQKFYKNQRKHEKMKKKKTERTGGFRECVHFYGFFLLSFLFFFFFFFLKKTLFRDAEDAWSSILLLCGLLQLGARPLATVLEKTFNSRNTQTLPPLLTQIS